MTRGDARGKLSERSRAGACSETGLKRYATHIGRGALGINPCRAPANRPSGRGLASLTEHPQLFVPKVRSRPGGLLRACLEPPAARSRALEPVNDEGEMWTP